MESTGLHGPSGLYWSLWWIFSMRWLKHTLRFLWVLVNNFYVIPAHCVWLLLLWPISLVWKKRYWQIEEYFFGRILGMVACWNYTAGYRIFESGDSLEDVYGRRESYLFMPNHQSTADVPLCMTIFSGNGRYPSNVMWIMDKVFKYTNFGLVSWLHDDFFITAGKDNRERSLAQLREHLANVFVQKERKCLVLFPEGGFLRKRKAVSNRFAVKNKLPLLDHCTLPRTGALEVIMEILGSNASNSSGAKSRPMSGHNSNGAAADVVKRGKNRNNRDNCLRPAAGAVSPSVIDDKITKVVDVTIAYEGGRPLDLLDILSGWRPPCITHVHYRTFDTSELPSDPEQLRQWMYSLYYEKEEMLKKFYETGEFPYSMHDRNARSPAELVHDPSRYIIFNAFYLVSTYLFWKLGSAAFVLAQTVSNR